MTDNLHLHVGQVVELELAGGGRQTACVIGYLPGASVLVEAPMDAEGRPLLNDKEPVVVRYLRDDYVHAFRTAVLKLAKTPYPYAHLAFPAEVTSARVRHGGRVPVHLEGRVLGAARIGEMPVMVTDISITGARLLSPRPLGETGSTLRLQVGLAFGELEGVLDAPVVIRNVSQSGRAALAYEYGVAFGALTREDRLFLQGFVCEHVLGE